jgi:GNAT superfamily N-acetyltransferase
MQEAKPCVEDDDGTPAQELPDQERTSGVQRQANSVADGYVHLQLSHPLLQRARMRGDLDAPHVRRKIDEIADSIHQHGYQPGWQGDEPITIDTDVDGEPRVTNGNKRLRALQQVGWNGPVPIRRRALVTTPPPGENGLHERHAGKGKPRHDSPDVARRAEPSAVDPERALEHEAPRDVDPPVAPDPPGRARFSLIEHPAVLDDVEHLPPKVQDTYFDRVDALERGDRHSSTHALHGPLVGWAGTSIGGTRYRIIHRFNGDELHVLSAGVHDEAYDDAKRRKRHFAAQSRLSDESRVSVAEHIMEQNGHSGRSFDVPNNGRMSVQNGTEYDWDDDRKHPAAHYVHDALIRDGHDPERARRFRVYPDHWNLDETHGQAITDGLNYVGTRDTTNELALLHECAHIRTRTPEGPSGHGQAFQETAHRLYHRHLGPEAAGVFRGLLEASGSQKLGWRRHFAVQQPPEGLSFKHKERESGGSWWPTFHNIFAYKPGSDTNVGNVSYYTHPRRKTLLIDGLYVAPEHQRQGIGSALMDEVQRQHSDHAIDHGSRTDDGKAWWAGYSQGRTVRRGRTAALEDDDAYRMQHRPPGRDGIPIHDLTQNFPADVYTHPHYYSDMSEPSNQVAHQVIRRVRGKPDAKVHIYRALPAEHAHQGIRPGDWVTTSKDYARQHGRHSVDPKHDWPVIHTVVRADDLHTDGDDWREFGYNGAETRPGNVAFKGGYHEEVSDRTDGGVRQVQRKQGPLTGKGYSFSQEHDHVGGTGGTVRAWHHDEYAGHMHYNADGSPEEPHIEPEHAHLADELIRRMRMKLPPRQASTYTVRLEHGRRRSPHQYTVPDDGPVTPAYLEHPVDVSYVHISVPAYDEDGNHRGDLTMENEARNTAVRMHHDQPGVPTDMVTRAQILSVEASARSVGSNSGAPHQAAWRQPGDVMIRMHPADLMPHIGDFDPDENLTDSMREHGWNQARGKRFLRQRGQYHEDDKPVTLWHTDQGSYVEPGNHRVPAANAAGLDSIPVLVKDRRTKTAAAARGIDCDECGGVGSEHFSNDKGQHWDRTCYRCGGLGKVNPPDAWKPPELPAEQQKVIDTPGASEYGRAALQLAHDPVPGTHLWRGEIRHKDELDRPSSVGMHWTVRPDMAIVGHNDVSPDHRAVLWQAVLDHPEQQIIPRSHPIWRGKHRSLDPEAEVRLRPGSTVRLNGVYVQDHGDSGHPWPFHPERTAANWSFHELDHHAPVEHRTRHDFMDYSEQFPDLFRHLGAGIDVEYMPLEQFRQVTSPQHRVPVSGLRDAMRANYARSLPGERHFGEETHGGSDQYLDHLRGQVARDGLREPLEVGYPSAEGARRFGPGPHLTDGNHRAVVVNELGIDPVPVRWTNRTHGALDLHQVRVLNPTTGHDPDLFDDEELKPEIRRDLIHRWTVFCAQHGLANWHAYTELYFTGGEASNWSGPGSSPNGDFDMQVGLDFDEFRAVNVEWKPLSDAEVSAKLNDLFWTDLDDHDYHPAGSPRVFDLTWFSNPAVNPDISAIRPYAAWNVLREEWAVHPKHYVQAPHLPAGVRKALQGADRYARQVLALPEPQRTREAAALFESWHTDRSAAFGPGGAGVFDYANLRMKALEATGVWQQLQDAANRLTGKTATALGERLWGAGDPDALFNGNPVASTPFAPAGRSVKRQDYDKERVRDALLHPDKYPTQPVDPRNLRSTQPMVTRAGVQHYMRNPGSLYADQHNAGNARPMVYRREDGQDLLLSGHHRGVSSLLKAEPLHAVVVEGPWGGPRVAPRKPQAARYHSAMPTATEYPPIYRHQLSTPDARRSREVSPEEFQETARRGHEQYERLRQGGSPPHGLDRNWDHVVRHAYQATREPWGGATYNAHTGEPVESDADAYALTVRHPGMPRVEVPPDASEEEFSVAMHHARNAYHDALHYRGAHLGVFHDVEKGSVDIDPVTIVHSLKDAEELGAYTHATGGAYHFKSGEGFWPPHVRES